MDDPIVQSIDRAPLALWRELAAGAVVARANLVGPERPDRWSAAMWALQRWGASLPGAVAASAARRPGAVAVVDEEGPVTYTELWGRSRALAAALLGKGIGPGSTVGLLARTHAGFVTAAVAATQTGADLVLLNTGFSPAQLADVLTSEGVDVVIHDDEFAAVAANSSEPRLDEGDVERLIAGHGA